MSIPTFETITFFGEVNNPAAVQAAAQLVLRLPPAPEKEVVKDKLDQRLVTVPSVLASALVKSPKNSEAVAFSVQDADTEDAVVDSFDHFFGNRLVKPVIHRVLPHVVKPYIAHPATSQLPPDLDDVFSHVWLHHKPTFVVSPNSKVQPDLAIHHYPYASGGDEIHSAVLTHVGDTGKFKRYLASKKPMQNLDISPAPSTYIYTQTHNIGSTTKVYNTKTLTAPKGSVDDSTLATVEAQQKASVNTYVGNKTVLATTALKAGDIQNQHLQVTVQKPISDGKTSVTIAHPPKEPPKEVQQTQTKKVLTTQQLAQLHKQAEMKTQIATYLAKAGESMKELMSW